MELPFYDGIALVLQKLICEAPKLQLSYKNALIKIKSRTIFLFLKPKTSNKTREEEKKNEHRKRNVF